MAKKISQAEARRLKRRVAELEAEKRNAFYGPAVGLVEFNLSDWASGMLQSADRLGHRLVARYTNGKCVVSALR